MKKSNYVTVNTDSTIESVNLSTINLPLEGYPLLLIMENLKEINKILEQKISKLKDATSGHKASTPASARKKKEMEKLEQEQNDSFTHKSCSATYKYSILFIFLIEMTCK